MASIGSGLRVALAVDSGLFFSDDYHRGWHQGFVAIGCEVASFDIKPLRRLASGIRSPYRPTVLPGSGKMLAQQIAKWKPDLVWCHHGRAASNPEFLDALHRAHCRTAVYLCDEPYETGETAMQSPRFQYVFSMDPCTVETHRLSRVSRKEVFYLPPCADTSVFVPVKYDKRTKPPFFLGNATLVPRPDWLKPVERVAEADIRFWKTTTKHDVRWVPTEKHPEVYSSCTVGLNVHRDPGITIECWKRRVVGRSKHLRVPSGLKLCSRAPTKDGTGFWNDGDLPAAHVNPRFFEMASCGTLVVSDDHRSELARMFPMAPRAQDPEHFLELVLYYQQHLDEAEAIGQACSSLISKRHSYAHRAAEVLIRAGLLDQESVGLHSSLGPPEDWLSPQDYAQLTARSSSEATGPSERWSPQSGMSLIKTSGSVSDATSIDVPTPW